MKPTGTLRKRLAQHSQQMTDHLIKNDNRTTPTDLMKYIEAMFAAYGEHKDELSTRDFIQYIAPQLLTFASYLGAAKDLQIFRDGEISHYLSRFDAFMRRIHELNEEVSIEIMSTWPRAYWGIDEDWTSVTKLYN